MSKTKQPTSISTGRLGLVTAVTLPPWRTSNFCKLLGFVRSIIRPSPLFGKESRHDRAVIRADAPVGQRQHVGAVGVPFPRQAAADQDVIDAAVGVFFPY